MFTCESIGLPTALLFTQIIDQCTENYYFLIPSLYVVWQFGQTAEHSIQLNHHIHISSVQLACWVKAPFNQHIDALTFKSAVPTNKGVSMECTDSCARGHITKQEIMWASFQSFQYCGQIHHHNYLGCALKNDFRWVSCIFQKNLISLCFCTIFQHNHSQLLHSTFTFYIISPENKQ